MFNKIFKGKFLITLIFLFAFSTKIYAKEIGAKVTVSIHSFDKTITEKHVSARRFKNAIDQAALEEDIKLVYTQSGETTKIYSVNDIKNNLFNDNDGWNGFVIRNNIILEDDNFLNMELRHNDSIVLYYGKPDVSQIASQVDVSFENKLLKFDVYSKRIIDGKLIIEPVKNCNITLTNIASNERKFLVTNNNGKAYTKIDKLGQYSFYISDESISTYPTVVKTETFFYNHG